MAAGAQSGRSLVRVAIAVVALVTGVILACVLALAVLLLAARLVPAPWFFLGAGYLALVAAGLATMLAVRKILRLNGTWRSTAGVGVGLAMIVAVTAHYTILDRFPSMPVEPDPVGVRYWSIPDGRLAYYHLSAAPTSDKHAPVVFLHGGPGTPGEGLPTGSAELAALGYDVYAYDQLGAGRSSRLSDVTQYTVEHAVDDLDAVRRAIGAQTMILIGRSWRLATRPVPGTSPGSRRAGGLRHARHHLGWPRRGRRRTLADTRRYRAPRLRDAHRTTPHAAPKPSARGQPQRGPRLRAGPRS